MVEINHLLQDLKFGVKIKDLDNKIEQLKTLLELFERVELKIKIIYIMNCKIWTKSSIYERSHIQ